MTAPFLLRWTRERPFSAHHMLLRAAQLELQSAEADAGGELYKCLTTVLMSALAIEAFTNTVAERVLASWIEVERKPCLAKLKLLAQELRVPFDIADKPWSDAKCLFDFRNDLAHAKPEHLREDAVVTQEEYDELCFQLPESKLEAQLTIEGARAAVATAVSIRDLLGLAVSPENRFGLFAEMTAHSVHRE